MNIIYRTFLVLALLVSIGIYAQNVEARILYSDWSVSGEAFDVDGMNFTAEYGGNDYVRVNGPLGKYLLQVGECKHSEQYEVCSDEIDHDDRVEYRSGKEYPGLRITIKELEPQIVIERSTKTPTVDLGQRAEIIVILKNTGDKPALQFRYVDRFPPGVTVVSSNDLTNGRDHVEYTSVMSEGKTVTLKYTIDFKEFVEFSSQATAYWGEEQESVQSDVIEFRVNPPFKITQELKPEKSELNVPMTYTLNLQNLIKREVTISKLEIRIPKDIMITGASKNLVKEKDTYVFSGPVRDEEEYEIRFKIPKDGQYDFEGTLVVTSEGKEFSESFETPIRIGVSMIVPEIKLPEKAKEGENVKLQAVLRNIDEDQIANVTVRTKGNLVTPFEQTKVKVSDISGYELISKDIIAPNVERPTVYTLIVEGEYMKDGKTLRFSGEKSMLVEPQQEALQIRTVTSKNSIARGSTMQVYVLVKNVLTYPLKDVEVADLFPKRVNIPKGKPTANLDIDPNTEVVAYNYTMNVLPEFKEPIIAIETIANAQTKEGIYKAEKVTEIAIGKDIENEMMEEELSGSGDVQKARDEEAQIDDVEQEEKEDDVGKTTVKIKENETGEEKPGLFSRFWNWMKGLFGGD